MKKHLPAFTLIEVLISGVMVATVLGALLALISLSSRMIVIGQNQLVASELAREGIDIVHQVQTANCPAGDLSCNGTWVSGNGWTKGLLAPTDLRGGVLAGPVLKAITPTTTGFMLSTVSPTQSCSDYIVVATKVGAAPAEKVVGKSDLLNYSNSDYLFFCRRLYIEPVDPATIKIPINGGNTPMTIANLAQKVVRIRSQILWLGAGKSNNGDAFPAVDPTKTSCSQVLNLSSPSWCSEDVTLLTDWRNG